MIFKENFFDIAQNYNYFIFDVWGVIHDGTSAYPNVLEVLTKLKEQNKKICFLSNAPRRARKVAEILKKYGITEDFYEFIMTSGEALYQEMKRLKDSKKYFYIGPKKDEDLLHGLDYEMTNDASKADFAITTGFNDFDSTISEKIDQIHLSIDAKLELICANPDLIVVKKDGTEMLCAGVIAQKYQELGGKVKYFGKPFADVYELTHEKFSNLVGKNIAKNEILAIGDGLETDILGANNYQIDNILLTCGILSNKLETKYGEKYDEEKLEKICKEYNIYPKFTLLHL